MTVIVSVTFQSTSSTSIVLPMEPAGAGGRRGRLLELDLRVGEHHPHVPDLVDVHGTTGPCGEAELERRHARELHGLPDVDRRLCRLRLSKRPDPDLDARVRSTGPVDHDPLGAGRSRSRRGRSPSGRRADRRVRLPEVDELGRVRSSARVGGVARRTPRDRSRGVRVGRCGSPQLWGSAAVTPPTGIECRTRRHGRTASPLDGRRFRGWGRLDGRRRRDQGRD